MIRLSLVALRRKSFKPYEKLFQGFFGPICKENFEVFQVDPGNFEMSLNIGQVANQKSQF